MLNFPPLNDQRWHTLNSLFGIKSQGVVRRIFFFDVAYTEHVDFGLDYGRSNLPKVFN